MIFNTGKGKDGKSAYEIYVEHGGTLTEAQWLASLKATPPEYAATVDDMTDTSKVYLGSNGHLWAYFSANNNIFDPNSCELNKRRNSGGVLTDEPGVVEFEYVLPESIEVVAVSSSPEKSGLPYIVVTNANLTSMATDSGSSIQYAVSAGDISPASSAYFYWYNYPNYYEKTSTSLKAYFLSQYQATEHQYYRKIFVSLRLSNSTISQSDVENMQVYYSTIGGASWRDTGIAYTGQVSVINGTTFTPSVSSSGVISWTNDGGKENPTARDLVQAVIDAIGTPVIGTVDSNNQISLSSNGLVEEGTYTVKYVKEDMTEVDIGTLTFTSTRLLNMDRILTGGRTASGQPYSAWVTPPPDSAYAFAAFKHETGAQSPSTESTSTNIVTNMSEDSVSITASEVGYGVAYTLPLQNGRMYRLSWTAEGTPRVYVTWYADGAYVPAGASVNSNTGELYFDFSTPRSGNIVGVIIFGAGTGANADFTNVWLEDEGEAPQRVWTNDWCYNSSNNTVGANYSINTSQHAVMQYPNKACQATTGDEITISADTSLLNKLDIVELYPVSTMTPSGTSGTVLKVTNVLPSDFVNGKYTYTATESNCAALGFRFKSQASDGTALAASITFTEGAEYERTV